MPSVGRNAWEEGLFVVCSFFVLATISGLGRLLLQWQPDARLWMQSALKALAPEEVAEEVLSIARARLLMQKELQFRRFFRVLGVFSTLAGAAFMGQVFLRQERTVTKVQDVCLLAMMAASALTIHFQSLISVRSMDCLYVGLMCWAAVMVAPFAVHPCNLVAPVVLAVTISNALCFVRVSSRKQGLPCFLLCNALVLASTAATREKFRQEFPAFGEQVLAAQVMLLAACAGGAHCIELGMQSAEVRAVQCQVASEEKGAAWALLRSICDVVVELDEEGAVASEAANLASFLLRGTASSLQGLRLMDLVAEEDRQRLEARLRAPAQESLAENVPMSLRDGDGNWVRVEVLLFPFRHFGRQRRFIAGIRECSLGLADRGPVHAEGFAVPETTSVSSSVEDPVAVLAWVDCLPPGLPVRRLSDGFCLRIGRLAPDSLLLDVVADPRAFVEWMDLAVVGPVPDHLVTLLMPQGPMRAACRVLDPCSTESFAEPSLICLGFSPIVAADQRPSRPSRRKGTPRLAPRLATVKASI